MKALRSFLKYAFFPLNICRHICRYIFVDTYTFEFIYIYILNINFSAETGTPSVCSKRGMNCVFSIVLYFNNKKLGTLFKF